MLYKYNVYKISLAKLEKNMFEINGEITNYITIYELSTHYFKESITNFYVYLIYMFLFLRKVKKV